jgi:hypothetical protein
VADSIVDFAGLDSAAAAVVPAAGSDSNVQVPPDTAQNTGEDNAEVNAGEGAEAKEGTEQGTEKNEDGTPKADALDNAKSPTPQNVRQALKAWRDSDPENKENGAVVKELHNAYERKLAYDAEFKGGVMEARKTTAWLKEISGGTPGLEAAQSSWAATQEQLTQIQATDELLYAGSPELIENIVADLKSEGKIDALGRMAPAFMEALKANDPAGYVSTLSSLLPQALREAEVDVALNSAFKAISEGNTEQAKSLLKGIGKWFSELEGRAAASKKAALDPEKQALAKEKADWETQKVTERTNGIAKEAETLSNKVLGNELKAFLKEPFFKQFSRENLKPLGNSIKQDMYATLKADKPYQAQMKAMWAAKNPDRAKIVEYHKAKLESIAAETVRNAVDRMYPNHARGGAAAGRAAEAKAKQQTQQKANATAVATGKPVFVATKPKLDEIDWSKDPKEYLHIAGRAYLKSGKYVTWRRS